MKINEGIVHDEQSLESAQIDDIFSITSCNRKSCVTCTSRLCYDKYYTNYTTKTDYFISFNGSCQTKNCVYIIKCKHEGCKYQYVGHTINSISSRISQHKSTIKRGGGCKILRDHFTKVHDISDMSIMPIKLLPENSTLKERENIEESCMPRGKTGPSYHPSLTTILITKGNNRHKIVQKTHFIAGNNSDHSLQFRNILSTAHSQCTATRIFSPRSKFSLLIILSIILCIMFYLPASLME